MSASEDGAAPPRAEGASTTADTLDASSLDPSAAASGGGLARGAAVGRYLVLSLLGRGGMGEVYAAYDPELDRRVAVKLLHAAQRSDAARLRLLREARALGKLSHPNVVQVYDVGEHREDVFLAMELVEGEPLDVWCRARPAPPWREVLGAYLDAARGLRAAHEKGLVHRDVKPANILRGTDGRVRVADFGLAARDRPEDLAPAPATAAPALDEASLLETLPVPSAAGGGEPLTRAGALVGTPLYMAPEQLAGGPASPASDQYGLCVALHEGLYGVSPYDLDPERPDELLARLLASKAAGPPPSPPAGAAPPPWIYRALARGLLPDPADRYPSVDALIGALSDDPDARRRARRRRAGVAAGAAALLALGAAGWLRGGLLDDPCKHGRRELSGVWDETVRERVRTALAGTGRSSAAETFTRVSSLLDAHAAAYVGMRGEVCEASRRGAQRQQITVLRDACLDRRRAQLGALAAVLAEKPEGEVFDKAVPAALGLPPVAYCADVEALTAGVHPPEDPATRARAAALQRRIDQLAALEGAGRYAEGLALGDALLPEATSAGYPPVEAEARYWLGRIVERVGDHERAKALLRQAAAAAAAGRDYPTLALAWARVLFVLGEHQQRFAEATAIQSFGPTLQALAGDSASRGAWLNAEGLLLYRMGKNAEAQAIHERALALNEQAFGPDSLQAANALHNLGLALTALGDHPRALAAHQRALSIFEKLLGPEHVQVAQAQNSLGILLFDSGDLTQAKARYERAAQLYAKALGPDHPVGADALLNLGNVHFVTGDYAGAKAAYARALAMQEKARGPEHPNVALALANLGEASFGLGDYAGAEALGVRALAIREKVLGPAHPDTAATAASVARARIRMGRLDEAAPLVERSLAAREKGLGPTNPSIADALLVLAELRLAQKKPGEAAPLLERAAKIADPYTRPEVLLTLAEALVAGDRERKRARGLAEEARAAYERGGHRPGLERASRFLADHPRQ